MRQQAGSSGGDERLHHPEPGLGSLSDQHTGLQLPPDAGPPGDPYVDRDKVRKKDGEKDREEAKTVREKYRESEERQGGRGRMRE